MRIDLLMEALPIMCTGYLGIFIVTGVIILVVSLLNKIGRK
ncbi:MAG: sodium pump decarboxylase gamma subunit [Oscillospiraceae bacterium]|nr:sodium pump decarboxylase gamma subunit [Oscillospiraceae bacterium]